MKGVGTRKTVCEFFAGIGLVHEALRKSGWKCIYANDFDPKKRQMYEGNYGSSRHYHECDIWDVDSVLNRIAEKPFLATASFPCTDMSLAGNMRGFKGKESIAFFGFLDVLKGLGEQAPKIVLLENVPGFFHSHGGRDFLSATVELAKLGYWLDAFVVDARYFVPQSRPRLFIVGYHESIVDSPLIGQGYGDEFSDDRWLEAIHATENIRPKNLQRVMKSTQLSTGWATVRTCSPRQRKYELLEYLDADDRQDWWATDQVERHYNMMFERHKNKIDAMTLQGRQAFAMTAFRRVRDGQQRTEVRFDGIAGCLRTPKGGSAKQIVIVVKNGKLKMRWMSPREYGRLQGANDYVLPENTIQGLFGFGDAVCVPVIQWIDQNMLTPIFEANNHQSRRSRDDRSVLAG